MMMNLRCFFLGAVFLGGTLWIAEKHPPGGRTEQSNDNVIHLIVRGTIRKE
jgi:hypothetical protein